MKHRSLLCAALFGVTTYCQSIVSTGRTLVLNGIHYYVPSTAAGKVPGWRDSTSFEDLVPITVINHASSSFGANDLDQHTTNFSSVDDVFQTAFTQALYIQYSSPQETLTIADSLSNRTIYSSVVQSNDTAIPNGPYFVSPGGSLYGAYRLYPDTQGAFIETAIPNGEKSYSVLPANAPGQSLAVAVPSRLYFTKTAEKPLAGVRLGVKDIFDVQGLKTSNGNRAWYHLYPEANETGPAVQNLLDAGAVFVGKMKTSQFAVDPRGDGYQDPSSSSAGPAAGIGQSIIPDGFAPRLTGSTASYPWLDIALGSDTGGSIRSPSQKNGVFGNRPTHGLVSLDNVMPLSPTFDTAGILTRDPLLWQTAAKALYGSNISTTAHPHPTRLLLTDYPTNSSSPELTTLLTTFLTNLTTHLNATPTPFNLSTSWSASYPTNNTNFTSYISNAYDVLTSADQARLVRDPFFTDYAAAHANATPFVDPSALVRWNVTANITTTDLATAREKQLTFQSWFTSSILPDCNTLLLYLHNTPNPVYRDTYLAGVTPPAAFSTSRISPMAGVPDFVVPIGEVAYESRVTGKREVLPVSVDLVMGRGCDRVLFELVEGLVEAGLVVREVRSGRSVVNGGEILL
ncbi:hypothetical protein PRZ48_003826 [Zasmidium cellare]|uniref:Amidase domain-containing protein n=1 Tax=Zasmidium cellare TaxID=395010 RepID=A0ABR0EW61_ZASCE|nr:hypothetical protein PRZ48_003826 [Zasmidium cellare]